MTSVRLQPVASPVDTFVTPGVQGPKNNTFDFSALRGLSSTLDQIALGENERRLQEAQRIAAEDAPRLEKLTRAQFEVLNAKDPLTKEQMDQLRAAGIRGADNPWAIQLLQKASGVELVRQNDIYGYLRDREWFAETSRIAAMSPGYGAAALAARVEEFNKKLGPIQNESAKLAAAVTISQEVEQVKKELKRASDAQFDVQQERVAAQAIQPAMDLGVAVYNGEEPDPSLSDKFRYALTIFRDQQKNVLLPEKADKIFAQALENSLSSLAKTDGQAALHTMDFVRSALKDDPNILPILDQVEARVERTVRQRDETGDQGISKARALALGKLARAQAALGPMTDKERNDWVFKGDGAMIVEQVAKQYGIDSAMLGEVQQSSLSYWSRQGQNDDEKTVLDVVQTIRGGDLEAAEIKIMAAGEAIGMSTKMNLLDRIDQKKKEPSMSPEARQARANGAGAVLEELGQVPDSLSSMKVAVNSEYERAFNEYLKQPGNSEDYVGAQQTARAAVTNSQIYTELQNKSALSTYSGLQQTPLYKSSVEKLLTDFRTDALRNLEMSVKETGAPIDYLSFSEEWAAVQAQTEEQLQRKYQELRADPSIRALGTVEAQNAEITRRLTAFAPEASRRARGMSQQQPPSPATLPLTSKNQIAQFEKLGGLDKMDLRPTVDGSDGLFDSGFLSAPSYGASVGNIGAAFDRYRAGNTSDGFFTLYALGPGNVYPAAGQSTLLSLGLAAEARLVDGIAAASIGIGENEPTAAYTQAMGNRAEVLNNYRMFLAARGLSVKEIASGKTAGGVPLDVVYGSPGSPWFANFPAYQIPIAATPAKLDEAVAALETEGEKSPLYRALQALRVDPTDSKAVESFVKAQRVLIKQRSAIGYGLEGGLFSPAPTEGKRLKAMEKLMSEVPKIRASDPEWLKRAKQRRIDAEN